MAQKIQEDNIEWEADHHEAVADKPLINDGTGKPIILRQFDFTLPPSEVIPTNEELLDVHRSKLLAFLWKDELVPVMDFKIVRSKDNHHFKIFATCQAKQGSVILDKPQLIQDIINAPNKHNIS